MERGRYNDDAGSRGQIGHIVVRETLGPRLDTALPERHLAVRSGETHITGFVRGEAERSGVHARGRDFGAARRRISIAP